MSRERCIELLEASHVGRVAWQSSDGQQILPVSYAYHQGHVIFRNSPYGVLSELVQAHDVAFEVDELDQNEHLGWSIVIRGGLKRSMSLEISSSSGP
jgi:nitroimidazol reductase NimA-like FMN-containing flavoprotein (pyridoxamine 5'-phosphate oxidase superfamily)